MGILDSILGVAQNAQQGVRGLLADPVGTITQYVNNNDAEAGRNLDALGSLYKDANGRPTFDQSQWSPAAIAANRNLTNQLAGAMLGTVAPTKLLSDASGAPIKMYRGSPNVDPAPPSKDALVFLTGNKDFAQNYAKGPTGKVHEFNVALENPFDASRGNGLRLWKQFVQDTGTPSWASVGTDRGALPVWTIEPQLREWLAKNNIAHDGIWFGESNGLSSLAVPSMSQLVPAK